MEDYNNIKRRYLDENKELVDSIIKDNANKEIVRIITNPTTEIEALIADSIINTIKQITELLTTPQDIDIPNLSFINLIIRLINALKNKDKQEVQKIKTYLNEIDPESAAHLIYEMYSAFGTRINETLDYIANQTGFNLKDSIEEFQTIFNKATNIISVESTYQIDFSNFNPNDPEEVLFFFTFTSEFSIICLKEKQKQLRKEDKIGN